MRTELSPSAVIPEWAKGSKSPNLLMLKYPYPPTLSTRVVPTSLAFQVMRGFTAQHRQTRKGLASSFLMRDSLYNSLALLKPIFKIIVRANKGYT
jgi:hypothetical protein